jgi:hypothetical protein
MHSGRIDSNTAAGRVYLYLIGLGGRWVGGWELAMATQTTAISTRISEIRHQLAGTGRRVETMRDGNRWFYRIADETTPTQESRRRGRRYNKTALHWGGPTV